MFVCFFAKKTEHYLPLWRSDPKDKQSSQHQQNRGHMVFLIYEHLSQFLLSPTVQYYWLWFIANKLNDLANLDFSGFRAEMGGAAYMAGRKQRSVGRGKTAQKIINSSAAGLVRKEFLQMASESIPAPQHKNANPRDLKF